MKKYSFEVRLAEDAAVAFSASAGMGCAVTSRDGSDVLCEEGYSCSCCEVCGMLGREPADCARVHLYGMTEAERFGGRYIYFCKRGFTFFTSPIIGQAGSEAKITVGPLLMVDDDDFLACELSSVPEPRRRELAPLLKKVPHAEPDRVTKLSMLLFMVSGFLNSVSATERLREQAATDAVQGQISAYIFEIKQNPEGIPYPYDKEREMIRAIETGSQEEAEQLLNNLLGHIVLLSGTDLNYMKALVSGLFSVISREVIRSGAEINSMQKQIYLYYQQLQKFSSMGDLFRWTTSTLGAMLSSVFQNRDLKHADVIHRTTQYIRAHISEDLEVEQLARSVYLSPDYFGRIFHRETGQTVLQYILDARLHRAVELMRDPSARLSDISAAVGFVDQSYFSRVFKKAYGVTPFDYRRKTLKKDSAESAAEPSAGSPS